MRKRIVFLTFLLLLLLSVCGANIPSETTHQPPIGDWPVLVWAANEDYRVYLRQVGAQTLTFSSQDGGVYDDQTHSRWDLTLGLALEGPLQGQALQQLPSLTSFDWAWLDFYPLSGIYGE
jgi:hypothetical protein